MRPRSTFDSVGRRNTRIEVHRVDERNAWMELGQFDDTQELGSTDLMRLRGLVSKLRWIDRIVLANWPEEAERGEALGIFPMRDRRDPVLDRAVCSSFLSPSD